MSWTPCPICGADGYSLRRDPLGFGWWAICPKCDAKLAHGATESQAAMFYTATHRRAQA